MKLSQELIILKDIVATTKNMSSLRAMLYFTILVSAVIFGFTPIVCMLIAANIADNGLRYYLEKRKFWKEWFRIFHDE